MSIRKFSKFNNVRTKYKGVTYDSRAEAQYAEILDYLEQEGQIKKIKRQVRFPLPNIDGSRTLRYVADFVVTSKTDKEYIIDVKGLLTPSNKVKIAYAQEMHDITVHLVPTTGPNKFDTSFIL